MTKSNRPSWIPENVWNTPLYKMTWLYTDQPTTCPYCGTRSELIFNLAHSIRKATVEQCLNPNCKFEFALEEDIATN